MKAGYTSAGKYVIHVSSTDSAYQVVKRVGEDTSPRNSGEFAVDAVVSWPSNDKLKSDFAFYTAHSGELYYEGTKVTTGEMYCQVIAKMKF